MPVNPDTQYTETQPWSSINTPTGVYKQGPDQIQKMAAATQINSLDFPAYVLRNTDRPFYANAVGLGHQPTIDDVINQVAGAAPQASIFDYSGTPAGQMASNAPNISLGA